MREGHVHDVSQAPGRAPLTLGIIAAICALIYLLVVTVPALTGVVGVIAPIAGPHTWAVAAVLQVIVISGYRHARVVDGAALSRSGGIAIGVGAVIVVVGLIVAWVLPGSYWAEAGVVAEMPAGDLVGSLVVPGLLGFFFNPQVGVIAILGGLALVNFAGAARPVR